MKTKELNNKLKTLIEKGNLDKESFEKIVDELGNALDPNLLFAAINSSNTSYIEDLVLIISKQHNGSLAKALVRNPIEAALCHYNRSLKAKLEKPCLNDLMAKVKIFQKYDCKITSNILEMGDKIDTRIANLLLDYKNIDLTSVKLDGFMKDLDVFKKLIEKGVDINQMPKIGDYPIFKAIQLSNIEIIDIMLKQNVNLDITSRYDKETTPLSYALLNKGSVEIAEKLIFYGCPMFDIKQINNNIHNKPHIINFFIKHDKSSKELIKNLDSDNVYEIFNEAKDDNKFFAISYLLNHYAKEIFTAIKKDGSQKENIKFFQKNGISFKFKFGEFIINSQPTIENEAKCKLNYPDLQEKSKTYLQDGEIFFDFTNNKANFEHENNFMEFVLSKKGILYVKNSLLLGVETRIHHSYFLKSKPTKELYGYAKPAACGGEINVIDGKVTFINNKSGYYKPTVNQLKLVVKYLHKKGVLAKDIKIEEYDKTPANLQDIINSDVIDDTPELFGKEALSDDV